MRLRAIHTVPVWRERDGSLTVGMRPRPDHPPVIGWCNMARIEIRGEARWFLLTLSDDA